MRLPQPPALRLPQDHAGRLGLAATGAVLWWTLALADLRILVALPLIAGGVAFLRRHRPTPPDQDSFDEWF